MNIHSPEFMRKISEALSCDVEVGALTAIKSMGPIILHGEPA